jgi:hypothetical protein
MSQNIQKYCPYCKKYTNHRKPCSQITKQSEMDAKKMSAQTKTRVQEQNRLETDIDNFSQNYPLLWKNISERLKKLEQTVQELEYRPNISE